MMRILLQGALMPLAMLATSAAIQAEVAQSYSVLPLPCPDGFSYAGANSMNEHGQIVGVAIDPLGFPAQVIWNANGSVEVGQTLPYGYSPGFSINDNGWTVGRTDYLTHNFVLLRNDRIVIKEADQHSAYAICSIDNSNNVAFADGGDTFYLHAMVQHNAQSKYGLVEDINGIVCPQISVDGYLYDGSSYPIDMNHSGQILGGSTYAVASHGWVYDIGTHIATALPAQYIFSSINNLGQVVGRHGSGSNQLTTLWTEAGGTVDLPPVSPPYNSYPNDINDAGTILNDNWTYDGTAYKDILDRIPMSPVFDGFINRSFQATHLDNRGRILVSTKNGSFLLIPNPSPVPHPDDISGQVDISYNPPRRDSARVWHQKVTISTRGQILHGPLYVATDGIFGVDEYNKGSLLKGTGETWYFGTEATGIAARQGVLRIAGPNQTIGPDPITVHLSVKGVEVGEEDYDLPYPAYTAHVLQGPGRY